ncbi:MAG: DUF4918 family protein [Thermoanaerobaculia bacterium]|nr:DUF4918 family protein [Thermoanaerobaculia bacterium]
MLTFADKVIQFNRNLHFDGVLPQGIGIMNPFRENRGALDVSSIFYKKYYDDTQRRQLILGINPGRFGAGLTGVPFTDPKRLEEKCGIPFPGPKAHEPSSVFVYEVIDAYGGASRFYRDFYINSVCPLGFVRKTERGEVNYNYYDSKELTACVLPFILQSIRQHIALGVNTAVCFCFGTGENYRFLDKINREEQFFGKIIPLDHPRFVMQYKSKQKQVYIDKYLDAFDIISRR